MVCHCLRSKSGNMSGNLKKKSKKVIVPNDLATAAGAAYAAEQRRFGRMNAQQEVVPPQNQAIPYNYPYYAPPPSWYPPIHHYPTPIQYSHAQSQNPDTHPQRYDYPYTQQPQYAPPQYPPSQYFPPQYPPMAPDFSRAPQNISKSVFQGPKHKPVVVQKHRATNLQAVKKTTKKKLIIPVQENESTEIPSAQSSPRSESGEKSPVPPSFEQANDDDKNKNDSSTDILNESSPIQQKRKRSRGSSSERKPSNSENEDGSLIKIRPKRLKKSIRYVNDSADELDDPVDEEQRKRTHSPIGSDFNRNDIDDDIDDPSPEKKKKRILTELNPYKLSNQSVDRMMANGELVAVLPDDETHPSSVWLAGLRLVCYPDGRETNWHRCLWCGHNWNCLKTAGNTNMRKHVYGHINGPMTLLRRQMADALAIATDYGTDYGRVSSDHFMKILPIKKKHEKRLAW